jgi:hypothetical protein
MSGSAYGRFEGFRDYIIESGANWTLAGNDRLDDGRTLTNDGTLAVSGDLYLTGRDGGGILVNSGQLIDTGLIQIGYDGTLDLASGTASGALEFLGPGGVLELAARSDVSLTVSGFGAGDQIDLPGIRYDAGQMSASYGSGLLTVFDRGTAVASFNVTGLPPGALPVIADAQGGTAIETLTTIYNGGASGQINKYTGCVVINGGSSDTTASIEAADFAIRIEGGLGAVENFGTLDGTAFQNQGYGVIIGNGGSVYNAASGTILGVSAGIDASVSDPLTVVNLGLVDASSGAGVELGDGGLVVNHTGGQITGAQRGVWSYGTGAPTTVINYGTISGGTDAIEFKLSTDLLIAKPGSDFVGLIVGGGGALKLSGGSGTITGLGATGTLSGTESGTFTGFGSYSVGVGGAWMLAGSDALATGQTLTDNGRVTVAGTLDLAGGVLVANGALVDGGTIEIGTGGTLDLGSPISSGLVDFTASGGVLELGQTSGVSLAIAGFVIGDQIDLSGVAYDAGHMRATYADGNLVVYDGAVERADLHLTGLPAGSFAVASDGHGGIDIGGVPTLVTIRSSGIAAFTPDVAGETVTLGVASGGVALSGDVSAVLVGHETQAGTTEFLAGNAGNDTICGAGGSGTIRSGSGANLIRTGGGSMVVVSQGRDTIRVGAGTVRIDATASATVFGGSGMTEVTDDGTTAGADKVHAGSGTTVMTSGLGRDSFIGGSGTAFMTDDGHGRVTFQFEKGLNGTDIVSGFDRATDSIRVVPGSVSWGDVLGRQTVAGGNTFIDTADGTRIEFVGVAGLTAADFKI